MFKEIAVFTDVVICLLITFGALWVWFTYLFAKQRYGTTGNKFISCMKETAYLMTLHVGVVPVITWIIGGLFFGVMDYYETYFSMVMFTLLATVVCTLIVINDLVHRTAIKA